MPEVEICRPGKQNWCMQMRNCKIVLSNSHWITNPAWACGVFHVCNRLYMSKILGFYTNIQDTQVKMQGDWFMKIKAIEWVNDFLCLIASLSRLWGPNSSDNPGISSWLLAGSPTPDALLWRGRRSSSAATFSGWKLPSCNRFLFLKSLTLLIIKTPTNPSHKIKPLRTASTWSGSLLVTLAQCARMAVSSAVLIWS